MKEYITNIRSSDNGKYLDLWKKTNISIALYDNIGCFMAYQALFIISSQILAIHTYIHKFLHTYIYAYIHTYIHTYVCFCKFSWKFVNSSICIFSFSFCVI